MKSLNLLIVEDHQFQRMYLQHQIKELGEFNVEVAQNGEEALQRLQQCNFDLILTDLSMPGMDGVQFIQRLAELPCKTHLAIMSMASQSMLVAASMVAKNLGIDVIGLISKPVALAALRGLIEQLRCKRQTPAQKSSRAVALDPRAIIQALSDHSIQAWFQPKQSLRDGRIVAAEALVRWRHPEQGTLLPGSFLPAIKAFDLEERLLWLMLEQVIEAQARWREQGYDIPVSINLPTHLLKHDDLADRLLEFVLRHRGIPDRICFELMENSTPEDISHFYAGACRLRMKGFGLSQDDFGKGYSSFANLLSTPFTELKIDRALVQGCHESESTALALTSIVTLGRKLGLKVVAEGVELPEELALLRRIDCDQAQGFLISQAVSSNQFQQLLLNSGQSDIS